MSNTLFAVLDDGHTSLHHYSHC